MQGFEASRPQQFLSSLIECGFEFDSAKKVNWALHDLRVVISSNVLHSLIWFTPKSGKLWLDRDRWSRMGALVVEARLNYF